jgi:drug/metabolite transporter (DMT)-like permease
VDKSRRIAYARAVFAVAVWGASFIATKVALTNGTILSEEWNFSQINSDKVALQAISPETIVWLRFAIGVAILGMTVILRREFALPDRKDLPYLALLGFIGITFHQWLQSTGLQTSQASTTAWIVATIPVFIAVLAWLFLHEKLGWQRVAGIAMAASGVLLVVSKGELCALTALFNHGQFGAPGDVLVLISAPNWAVFSVLSRRGLRVFPAARMMFCVMSLGWLFSSTLLFAGPGLSEVGKLSLNGWMGLLFLGIFCSGLAYIAWYDALQAVPASQVGVFLYLEPMVTVIIAAIVLGEPLLWSSLLGGGIILAGVWLVSRR